MVEREIRRVLAPVKGFDPDDREALSLWNTAIESVMFSKMMQSMKNFFLGVSLITLVLGGIGVMNIMLIAVRERTREIGLRKALGATSHSIHRQFVIEGLALTLLSGVLGLAAGWGLCQLINMLPMPARFSGMIITPGTGALRGGSAGRRRPSGRALSRLARGGAAARRVTEVRGLTCGSIEKSSARRLGSLLAHRFRAGLTMLGISWGIVTVVLLMAYGTGFQRAIMYGFRNAFSQGTVLVGSGQTSMQAGGERSGRRILLKQDDVDAVKELGSIKFVSPEYMQSVPISYGLRQTTAGVRGVAPEYGIMRTETAEFGRFLNYEDIENHRRVAFLGYEVARRLFSNIPAVGETIRINGVSFEVIGVMPNKAQISNYFYPDKLSVFIPYTVNQREYVDNILFQAITPELHDQAMRQVRELLATRHRFNPRDMRAVNIRDTGDTAAMIGGITDGLQFVLYFIGTLTLMIGGVGVMNIMLVSVTERTREIGVRKALGARRRHILTQFLLEALTITSLGGVMGILLSYLLVWLIGTRPFLATLARRSDKANGHQARHVERHSGHVDRHPRAGGNSERAVAGRAGIAARSHRSTALRVAILRFLQ